MSNRFEASLAGRVATAPVAGESLDGRECVRFRVAVPDRVRKAETGKWETSQTVFHDVEVFGALAERTMTTLNVSDPVLVQGEFRFRSYRTFDGRDGAAMSFVATRIGPDILLADVVVTRVRELETVRTKSVSREPRQLSSGRSL